MAEINPIVLKLLKDKCKRDITTPSGASYLRNDIEARTGELISLNTVKRFVGVLPYDCNHHPVIYQIIANYLGFESWRLLMDYINDNISFFITKNDNIIDLTSLDEGVEVEISWLPDRTVVIKNMGNNEYKVISAENSKLFKGDIIRVSQVIPGFPFVVNEVIRNDKCLGAYRAAIETGVKSAILKV